MSTIDKQWLQQKIAGMEATRDDIPFGLDEADSNTLAALRIALVSLEAEPVAFRSKLQPPYAGSERWDYTDHRQPDAFELENCFVERLYAAPPAPVSDSLLSELLGIAKRAADEADECAHAEFSDDSMEHSAAIADWERRAAMLQGADGTLTNEDTKRVDELVMWIKRLAHSLRKANPDSKLQSDVMDYLSRKGLIGVEDILR